MPLSPASATLSKRVAVAAGPVFLRRPLLSTQTCSRTPFRPQPPSLTRQTYRFTSSTPATMAPAATLRVPTSAIFVCDIQDKFRNAIHEFDKVVLTSRKVLRAAAILDIPVVVTTQNRARLGDTVPELSSLYSASADAAADTNKAKLLVDADKTLFSMWTPEVQAAFASAPSPSPATIVIVGIESHICVTQTTLDLLAAGHRVYVLADGVSSCNREEVPIALARLRAAGATVTTSESWMYETMGDAGIPAFRNIVGLVKDTSADTKLALSSLLSSKI